MIGDCKLPSNLEISSSLEGILASSFNASVSYNVPSTTPAFNSRAFAFFADLQRILAQYKTSYVLTWRNAPPRGGRKRFVPLTAEQIAQLPADARAVGFRAVCEKQKVSYQIADTTAFEYNHLEYHQILEKLLKENPDTDGIFASSDLIAAQLLQVCHNLNIDVPSQMKIVGFDDVNIASLTTPPITTIHQPIKEMAKMAVELLVRSGNGELVPNRTTLPVSLVVRETT